MTQEFILLKNSHISRAKKRQNIDVLVCYKCEIQLQKGDSVHHQRHHFYHAFCWGKAFLESEDET